MDMLGLLFVSVLLWFGVVGLFLWAQKGIVPWGENGETSACWPHAGQDTDIGTSGLLVGGDLAIGAALLIPIEPK